MLNLEYEGLHSICFHCGVYGHRMDVCPRVGAQAGSPGSTGKKGGDQAGGERGEKASSVEGSIGVEYPTSNSDAGGVFVKDRELVGQLRDVASGVW